MYLQAYRKRPREGNSMAFLSSEMEKIIGKTDKP